MRNPGQICEISEGTYKGKFFDVRNKDQKKQFTEQNKAVGTVCEDSLGQKIIAKNIVISATKLYQIGWID